jgi:hypothetical protein
MNRFRAENLVWSRLEKARKRVILYDETQLRQPLLAGHDPRLARRGDGALPATAVPGVVPQHFQPLQEASDARSPQVAITGKTGPKLQPNCRRARWSVGGGKLN